MTRVTYDNLDPNDLLTFIESKAFERAWKRCGLTDDDLADLQGQMTGSPKAGAVIAGPGGLRKLRFSPTSSNGGKSGSHRVLYCYFEEFAVVLLATAYPKSKTDTISAAAKAEIKKMIDRQQILLSKRPLD